MHRPCGDKCALHKTTQHGATLGRQAQRDCAGIKASTQAEKEIAAEEKKTCEAGPFRNESQNETQASDRDGRAA